MKPFRRSAPAQPKPPKVKQPKVKAVKQPRAKPLNPGPLVSRDRSGWS